MRTNCLFTLQAPLTLILATSVLAQAPATPSAPIITTVAGCCETSGAPGTSGYNGDGIPAIVAELNVPWQVAVDSAGDLYIADRVNCLIRKVTALTGVITTAAGTVAGANCGYSGDSGPATSAELAGPLGVALDAGGDLFIADYRNNVIRKVTAATGVISTVAGCCEPSGKSGYSGDGGSATSAELYGPTGVALDTAGNLYIADSNNNVIRKVTMATGVITTVAGCCETTGGPGTGGYSGDGGPAASAELYAPEGVAVDSEDNLYIADYVNCLARKVTASTGKITTVAGTIAGAGTHSNCGFSGNGGPATSAELAGPGGVALDSGGDLFIADSGNFIIREVNASTSVITTAAGDGIQSYTGDGGPATSASLSQPYGVAVDSSGNIYVGDSLNNVIRKVTVHGPTATATATAVMSGLNPSTAGEAVTFTATVNGGSSPTGSVGFTANGTAIRGCSVVTLSTDKAECTTSALLVGDDAVVATYSGDSN
ncbi:MAG: Ig-like domain repeat protein, partial [Terriglobales bacterium]